MIPVWFGTKKPVNENWPKLRLREEELPRHFRERVNIGVVNGVASGRLVDVDLVALEAIALAPHFLPPTGLIFGRRSKARSHWVYRTDRALKTKRFSGADGKRIAERLGNGTQTVWPPSKHESGERIEFYTDGDPARVSGRKLVKAVGRLAACALLARQWPKKAGRRHDIANAVGGFLLKGGVDEAVATKLVGLAAKTAGDEQWSDRAQDVAVIVVKGKTGGTVHMEKKMSFPDLIRALHVDRFSLAYKLARVERELRATRARLAEEQARAAKRPVKSDHIDTKGSKPSKPTRPGSIGPAKSKPDDVARQRQR